MPYVEYLQTPHWRVRRDRSLRLAGFRCSLCPSKRDLQVHHLNYERLGEERDGDLQVLCHKCHEDHHFDESRQQHLGIYLRLVSEALKAETFTTMADLSWAVKERCAKLGIPYDTQKVSRAIGIADSNRRGVLVSIPRHPFRIEHKPGSPISKAEAAEICRKLGLAVPFKSIKWAPFGVEE